jgi:hypothetical protein
LMATAAISSGRVARRPPLYARPTGVLTALPITTSRIIKTSKRLYHRGTHEENKEPSYAFSSVRLSVLCGSFLDS